MKKIRSSRALEEALEVRSDFRWLAEGRTVDHSAWRSRRRWLPESTIHAAEWINDLFSPANGQRSVFSSFGMPPTEWRLARIQRIIGRAHCV